MLLASFLSRNPVSWKAALFPVNQVVTSSSEVMTFYPGYFHQEKCKFYRAKQTGIFLWTIGMKPAHLFLHEKHQVNIVLWSWGSSSSKPTWDPLAQKLGFGFHGKKKKHPDISAFAGNPALYKGLLLEEKNPTKWLLGKSEKWEGDGGRGPVKSDCFCCFSQSSSAFRASVLPMENGTNPGNSTVIFSDKRWTF